ncbi:MAG: hypothetical protein QXS79_06585 [Candidatus Bathyarchaeia archaeon]
MIKIHKHPSKSNLIKRPVNESSPDKLLSIITIIKKIVDDSTRSRSMPSIHL